MNAGSLFTGIGGLDLGVGVPPAWFCEYDKHCRTVLERRFPGVPVYPDVRDLGDDTPPVDILVGGYPCQPFSVAGLRKGEDDPRHLWPHFARLIRVLRPRVVVAENVAGHLRLGFHAVLADLADLGMDVRWGVVRASDVGAPHRRERLFIVAWDAARLGRDGWSYASKGSARPGETGLRGQVKALLPTPSSLQESTPTDSRIAPALLPTPTANDHTGGEGATRAARQEKGDTGGPSLRDIGHLMPTPTSRDWKGRNQRNDTTCLPGAVDRLLPTPVVTGSRRSTSEDRGVAVEQGDVADGRDLGDAGPDGGHDREAPAWGVYEGAIRQWEWLTGAAAPAPTDARGRLMPEFVEWMMGFPAGWTEGASRTQRLKMLGNAVVPQQAALALSLLSQGAQS